MDVTTLLRCTRRIATCLARATPEKIFAAVGLAALLGGCSQVPPEYDPINWTSAANREVMSWFGEASPEPPPIVEPPPAEGRPIPNLGTVPPPPLVTPQQRVDREKELASLQQQRAAAAKADAALRAGTAPAGPSGTPSTGSSPPAPPPDSGGPPPGASAASPPPSVATGAAPAPVIELPSLPPAAASGATRSAANLLTTSERHGAVSFGPEATSLSAAGRNTLDAAAAAALTNDGRVRLVPVQIDGAAAAPDLVTARETSIRDELTSLGVPKDRITIGEVSGRRVDMYDVYVDD